MARSRWPRRPLVAAIVLFYGAATLVARRRGYGLGGRTTVRCLRGHLFSTIWIPGATFKALKLGWWRLQWCPVGRHVTLVRPVREAELDDAERASAEAHRDVAIP